MSDQLPFVPRFDDMRLVGDYPTHGARRFPERSAIMSDSGAFTYDELNRASDRFAAWLAEQGLAAGSRIAYLGKNSELMFPVLFGCIRAGCVLVPINWRYAVPEVAYVVGCGGRGRRGAADLRARSGRHRTGCGGTVARRGALDGRHRAA